MKTAGRPTAERLVAAVAMTAGIGLAAALPITGREAYTFVHFVRPPVRDLLGSFDPAEHVLPALLMKRAVGLLRLSAFSLRVPGLIGLGLFLWAVTRLAGRLRSWRWLVIAAAGAGYSWLEYATAGTGFGLAFGLWACAVELSIDYLLGNQLDALANLNLVGICLGLSLAANCAFVLPSLALALVLLAATRKVRPWIERVVVTATVTAFLLLVLPFSHATAGQLAGLIAPPAFETSRSPEDLSGLMAVLSGETRGRTVRIAASPGLVTVLEFYQARYREGGWRISEFAGPGQGSPADYYVLNSPLEFMPQRILYRGRRVVMAQ